MVWSSLIQAMTSDSGRAHVYDSESHLKPAARSLSLILYVPPDTRTRPSCVSMRQGSDSFIGVASAAASSVFWIISSTASDVTCSSDPACRFSSTAAAGFIHARSAASNWKPAARHLSLIE